MSRIIGELGGTKKGPLIILIGGLHGNELKGIEAIERVFNKIKEDNLEVRGKIIGLKGNKKAIEKIYRLRQRDKKKPFSFICSDLKHISDYAKVSI